MRASWRSARAGLWASLVWCLLAGCASPAAEAPKPRQPLPEARAREVIASAVRDAGLSPRAGHTIKVKGGRPLEVDVGVVDRKYGVAYVSGTERALLGDSIPAHDVGSASLVILRDIGDRENAVLLLHDVGYVADEHLGTEREKTGIAAELKLARDVKDFLAKARSENWP